MASSTFQNRRVWLGGAVVAAVLLAAVSWLLLIKPVRSATADLEAQAASVEAQNQTLIANNAALLRQYDHIDVLRSKLSGAVTALPPTSGLTTFTHEATALAAARSVTVEGINVGAIAPLASDSQTAPAATTDTSGASRTSSSGGVFTIAVTVQTKGSVAAQTAYLHALETGPRAVVVTSSQFATVSQGSQAASMTIQLTLFSAPMSAEQQSQLQHLLAGS